MWAAFLGALAIVPSWTDPLYANPEDPIRICIDAQKTIDAEAPGLTADRTALYRVAPFCSAHVIAGLLTPPPAAASGEPVSNATVRVFRGLVGAGLTQQAEALRALRAYTEPRSVWAGLGRDLGLFALGDGSSTTTIAAALRSADDSMRRANISALARMRHARAQTLLALALEDRDESLRLRAARALLPFGFPRAQRVLLDLSILADREMIRHRAARLLLNTNISVRKDVIARWPEDLRATAWLREVAADPAADLRRNGLRMLEQHLHQGSWRAAVLAVMARARLEPAELRRLPLRATAEEQPAATAELAMAALLAGDSTALERLVDLDRAGTSRAVLVLSSFSELGGRRPESALEDVGASDNEGNERADSDVRVLGEPITMLTTTALPGLLERWFKAGKLGEYEQIRALQALEVLAPSQTAGLVRTRLQGLTGSPQRFALGVLRRHGRVQDVPALLQIAAKTSDLRTQGRAWAAAGALCQH